jgi:DNA ligase-1
MGTEMITKPMLAGTVEDLTKIQYPVIVSPKLDGIRALKINGRVVSRTFKTIPNHYIRKTLEQLLPDGADGEIMTGQVFQDVSSGVMSREGEPAFQFWMFDYVQNQLEEPYHQRVYAVQTICAQINDPRVKMVETWTVSCEEELLKLEQKFLDQGYEGIMIRDPHGPYKCGRSTLNQGWLLKLKRFEDSEAEVLGFIEQQKNTNKAEKDELGHTKRSSAKAGKVGKGTLGKIKVRDLQTGQTFKLATGRGLTDKLRKKIWANKAKYQGAIVKYKWQVHGTKDKPRIPIFLGFRDPIDISS